MVLPVGYPRGLGIIHVVRNCSQQVKVPADHWGWGAVVSSD